MKAKGGSRGKGSNGSPRRPFVQFKLFYQFLALTLKLSKNWNQANLKNHRESTVIDRKDKVNVHL